MTTVNGEVGKVFRATVMDNSVVASQALLWVTAKGLLDLPAFVQRT